MRPYEGSSGPTQVHRQLGGWPPRRAARRRDFLWFMSSDFCLTLPQLLARHGRQVVLLVIRDLAVPHDEDDLQPFRPERPERLAVTVAPRPLLVVVHPGPVAGEQREEGHLVDHVPQRLVTGEAEVDDPLLAASFRHGYGAGLRLQMSKRLPPSGSVPQTGPERRRGDTVR